MVLTVSNALKVPIILLIGIALLFYLLGDRGINGTIDLGQKLITIMTGEAEAGGTSGTTSQQPDPVAEADRAPSSSLGNLPADSKLIEIMVWDYNGMPIGGVRTMLRHDFALVSESATGSQDGRAFLDYGHFYNGTEIPDSTIIQLLLNPADYKNRVIIERNTKNLIVNSNLQGSVLCFMQVRPEIALQLNQDFIQIEDCIKPESTTALEVEPVPTKDVPNPSKVELEDKIPPVIFKDSFDDNRRGWNLGDQTTESNSVQGDIRIESGHMVLNSLFANDFRMYRTDIPLEKELKNFGLSVYLSSIVQPQTVGHFGRFNIQFRTQDDGRYYNLCIDQNGHTTLYFFYPGEDGLLKHELIESFPLPGYNPDLNAVNHLFLQVENDKFTVGIENQPFFIFNDLMRHLNDSGGMSIGIDGTAGNVIRYHMDNLLIQEWPSD